MGRNWCADIQAKGSMKANARVTYYRPRYPRAAAVSWRGGGTHSRPLDNPDATLTADFLILEL